MIKTKVIVSIYQRITTQSPLTNQCVYIHTYCAIANVEEDLLSLLRPTYDVREAGSLLRCHSVVGKAALESSSFHT